MPNLSEILANPSMRDRALAGAASVIVTEYSALGIPEKDIDHHLAIAFDPTRSAQQQEALIVTATQLMEGKGIKTTNPVLDTEARRLHRKLIDNKSSFKK